MRLGLLSHPKKEKADGGVPADRRGRYSIAPRGMVELEPYIRNEHDEYYKTCAKCRKMVLTVSRSRAPFSRFVLSSNNLNMDIGREM